MKSYLKTTAGVILSATMATASYGATVNVGASSIYWTY